MPQANVIDPTKLIINIVDIYEQNELFAVSNCHVGLVKSVSRSRRDWLRLPACAIVNSVKRSRPPRTDRIGHECLSEVGKSPRGSGRD